MCCILCIQTDHDAMMQLKNVERRHAKVLDVFVVRHKLIDAYLIITLPWLVETLQRIARSNNTIVTSCPIYD